MDDVTRVARKLADLTRKVDSLSRAQQVSRSTVEVEGATVPVPVALTKGFTAGAIAEQVREDLDEARTQLEAADAALESRTDDAEQALADAELRLDGAEGRIDEVFTLAEQAKSNMPNRVDDPDFSFGDQDWQGEGGQFAELAGAPAFLIGGRWDGAAVTPVAETVDRLGTTAGAAPWATQDSTYELRLEGVLLGTSVAVTFGGFLSRQQVTKTITSNAEMKEPIRLTWPDSSGFIRVRIQATTSGAANGYAYLTAVSVTDVTAITQVKATADEALLSANGKQNIYRDAGDPSGAAPENSVWFKVDGNGTVVGQYQYVDDAWVETPVASEVIANLDVGKLTAGSGVVGDLVAQELAAATGAFMELDVGQLVASQAVLDEAVANKIWSDSVVTNLATAQQIIAGEAIIDGTVTAAKLQAEEVAAALGQFIHLNAEQLDVGSVEREDSVPFASPYWEPIPTPNGAPGYPTADVAWRSESGENIAALSGAEDPSRAEVDMCLTWKDGPATFRTSHPLLVVRFAARIASASVASEWGSPQDYADHFNVTLSELADIYGVTVAFLEGLAYAEWVNFIAPKHTSIDARFQFLDETGSHMGTQRSGGSDKGRFSGVGEWAEFERVIPWGESLPNYVQDPSETRVVVIGTASQRLGVTFDIADVTVAAPVTETFISDGVVFGRVVLGSNGNFSWVDATTVNATGTVYAGRLQVSGESIESSDVAAWNASVHDEPATGTYSAGSNIAAGQFFDQVVTFPAGKFTSAPKIVAGSNQVRILVACTTKSATQATLRVYNVSSGTAAGTCTVDWIATP